MKVFWEFRHVISVFYIIFRRGAPQGGLSCPFGAIHLLYGGKHSSHGATCERGPAPKGRTSFAPKRSAGPRRSRGLPSCRRWRHGAISAARRKESKSWFPAACTAGNILLRPQVWKVDAPSGVHFMRAVGLQRHRGPHPKDGGPGAYSR